jgi:hypothetical protein
MARVKKTLLDKEKELKQIISDAKKKLASIHNKQKTDIGELAFKHGLHEFDLSILDSEFKKLSTALKK